MKTSHTYSTIKKKSLREIACFLRAGMVLIFLLMFITRDCFASIEPGYDEISIFINVQDLGEEEVPAIIRSEVAYLSIADVFDFLQIRNTVSPGGDSISGFLLNPASPFLIDQANHRVIFKDKMTETEQDGIIKVGTNLYMRLDYFGRIFGLDCTFNFRSLSVVLKSEAELPAIREKRLEQMRLNIKKLNGEFVADTSIGRNFPLFHFGTADWSVIATRQLNGISYNRFDLGAGALLAGGEVSTLLTYTTNQPFSEKQQYFLWRYANNDHSALRQVMAGTIAVPCISTIYQPIAGLQFTNAPTFQKKSFGTYALSNYTKPDWIVELYVNNVLVDYVKADATGFFTFNVPLMYGSTDVTLRYYGPWGEEQTSRQKFDIPFNFLTPKQFEYKASGGIVEDGHNSLFTQERINYGLSRAITIGGGLEYLSSVSQVSMPFINSSIRLTSNLLFAGEYVYGVRTKSMLSFHLPSNFQAELSYSKYDHLQEAVKYNYTEERKLMLSMPFHFLHIAAFSRFTLRQNILSSTRYTNSELMLTGALRKVSLNFTSYAFITNKTSPYIYTSASLSLSLPESIVFRGQVIYEYTHSELNSVTLGLEKHILKHAFANVSYQQNFSSNLGYYQLGLRYDFSFAHTAFSATHTKDLTTLSESAGGNILYESKTNYFTCSQNSQVGKGGIILTSFLDINSNGKRDKDEPKIAGMNIRMSESGSIKYRNDTTIIISGLEPYRSYLVELNGNNFENIAWKIVKPAISVAINPNQLRLIEIPVTIAGEASGMIYKNEDTDPADLGGIKVDFFNADSILVATVLTEADGFFSFLGLAPGNYTARLDLNQLKKLNIVTLVSAVPFTIHFNKEGDAADQLSFSVQQDKPQVEN